VSYPFVAAAFDDGPRKGPILGLTIHMAEGGGTVGYLDRVPPLPARGVSVHYVIEYTGRIVQMLPESHASGSINPNDLRTNDDADGFFGITAARAVLGTWWKDPNSAVLSVEIEGFAIVGPNKNQQAALADLVNDLRTRYPHIGLLGHRDHQNYKPCPGRLIPWSAIGGHGPASEEDVIPLPITSEVPQEVRLKTGAPFYDLDGTTVLDKADAALDWRPSPYSIVPGYHAIFATIKGVRRVVLVKPAPGDARNATYPDEAAIRASQAEKDRAAAIAAVTASIP
jgi:N-acetylmuramoyl-L-alanine amidase